MMMLGPLIALWLSTPLTEYPGDDAPQVVINEYLATQCHPLINSHVPRTPPALYVDAAGNTRVHTPQQLQVTGMLLCTGGTVRMADTGEDIRTAPRRPDPRAERIARPASLTPSFPVQFGHQGYSRTPDASVPTRWEAGEPPPSPEPDIPRSRQ